MFNEFDQLLENTNTNVLLQVDLLDYLHVYMYGPYFVPRLTYVLAKRPTDKISYPTLPLTCFLLDGAHNM